MMYIEEAIAEPSRFVVFEPNNPERILCELSPLGSASTIPPDAGALGGVPVTGHTRTSAAHESEGLPATLRLRSCFDSAQHEVVDGRIAGILPYEN